MGDLVFLIGIQPLFDIDLVALGQIKQSPRRDRDHQWIHSNVLFVCHG